MKKLPIISIVIMISSLIFAVAIEAGRMAPMEVDPVIYNGVMYMSNKNIHQKENWLGNPIGAGYYVEAWDVETGKMIWELEVYDVKYIPRLEGDVQDKFITYLAIEDGKLIVVNECDDEYEVNLETKAVAKRQNPRLVGATRHRPLQEPYVSYNGVSYVAPHWGCEYLGKIRWKQKGAYIHAWDKKTSEALWQLKVYENPNLLYDLKLDSRLKKDAQYIFITDLCIEEGKLIVRNENGQEYKVNLETRKVSERGPRPESWNPVQQMINGVRQMGITAYELYWWEHKVDETNIIYVYEGKDTGTIESIKQAIYNLTPHGGSGFVTVPYETFGDLILRHSDGSGWTISITEAGFFADGISMKEEVFYSPELSSIIKDIIEKTEYKDRIIMTGHMLETLSRGGSIPK